MEGAGAVGGSARSVVATLAGLEALLETVGESPLVGIVASSTAIASRAADELREELAGVPVDVGAAAGIGASASARSATVTRTAAVRTGSEPVVASTAAPTVAAETAARPEAP